MISFCNVVKGQANCTNEKDLVLDPVLVDPLQSSIANEKELGRHSGLRDLDRIC